MRRVTQERGPPSPRRHTVSHPRRGPIARPRTRRPRQSTTTIAPAAIAASSVALVRSRRAHLRAVHLQSVPVVPTARVAYRQVKVTAWSARGPRAASLGRGATRCRSSSRRTQARRARRPPPSLDAPAVQRDRAPRPKTTTERRQPPGPAGPEELREATLPGRARRSRGSGRRAAGDSAGLARQEIVGEEPTSAVEAHSGV